MTHFYFSISLPFSIFTFFAAIFILFNLLHFGNFIRFLFCMYQYILLIPFFNTFFLLLLYIYTPLHFFSFIMLTLLYFYLLAAIITLIWPFPIPIPVLCGKQSNRTGYKHTIIKQWNISGIPRMGWFLIIYGCKVTHIQRKWYQEFT